MLAILCHCCWYPPLSLRESLTNRTISLLSLSRKRIKIGELNHSNQIQRNLTFPKNRVAKLQTSFISSICLISTVIQNVPIFLVPVIAGPEVCCEAMIMLSHAQYYWGGFYLIQLKGVHRYCLRVLYILLDVKLAETDLTVCFEINIVIHGNVPHKKD